MKLKYKVMFLNSLPFILLIMPMSLMMYITYGNPSEEFLDILNTISAWIFVSPLLLIVAACFIHLFDTSKEVEKCCCKCKCCCNKN